MAKREKKQKRYVRIDGLTVWQALSVFADVHPNTQIVVRNQRGTDPLPVTLLEHPNGPWIIENNVAKLAS